MAFYFNFTLIKFAIKTEACNKIFGKSELRRSEARLLFGGGKGEES